MHFENGFQNPGRWSKHGQSIVVVPLQSACPRRRETSGDAQANLSTHCISRSDPQPQLGAHMRQPRHCLRICWPRVTRTPSRVQATTRSDTRSLRRRPPGLTRAEPACSRQMGRESAHDGAPCQPRRQPRISPASRPHAHPCTCTCHDSLGATLPPSPRALCRRRGCRCTDPVSTLVLEVQDVEGFSDTLPPPPLAAQTCPMYPVSSVVVVYYCST